MYWPDQEPLSLEGPLKERLNHWMTLVHRGNVIEAYQVFLGMMQNKAERKDVLAEMCFAGLMDVQDRLLHNRSYTTGHKAYRARVRRWRSAMRLAGTTRMTWFTPARSTSRSGRAGIPLTKWPATTSK